MKERVGKRLKREGREERKRKEKEKIGRKRMRTEEREGE